MTHFLGPKKGTVIYFFCVFFVVSFSPVHFFPPWFSLGNLFFQELLIHFYLTNKVILLFMCLLIKIRPWLSFFSFQVAFFLYTFLPSFFCVLDLIYLSACRSLKSPRQQKHVFKYHKDLKHHHNVFCSISLIKLSLSSMICSLSTKLLLFVRYLNINPCKVP